MIQPAAVWEAWMRFFHAHEPATTIALFRILFAGLLLANAVLLARQARLFVGEHGVLPRARFLEAYGRSLSTVFAYLPGKDGVVSLVLGMHFVAAVSLGVGFWTRTSAAVAFITLVSLQHRNPLVLHGGDHVLRLMAFLLIFSRAGEMWSLDQWLAAGRGEVVAEARAWCTRLMQLQVAVLYLKSVVAKLEGEAWRQGTAVYYALESRSYRRLRLPRFARTLAWSRVATWGTLAIEAALGSLVWVPVLRYPVLAAGVALHVIMEVFLNLQLFGATMIVCLTLFLEPATVQAGLEGLRSVLHSIVD